MWVAGQINSRLRIIRPVAWVGYGLAAIGFGLFYRFYRYPFPEPLQLGLEVSNVPEGPKLAHVHG